MRRNLFQEVEEQRPRRFYGSRMQDEDSWQPGETLPMVGSALEQMDELKSSFHSMISTMQATITAELVNLKDIVTRLDERVAEVEGHVTASSSSSLASTPSSSSDDLSGKRKRRTPVHVQVC